MRKLVIGAVLFGMWCAGCRTGQDTVVRMDTSCGVIRLRLYDDTPLHRDNLVKLVREGFYDGMLFHRVIRDFMIQTGDPASREAHPGIILGDKDNGYTLKAEILPGHFHRRGALAAARENDNVNPGRESSGSHFYIVQGKTFTAEALEAEVERVNHKRYTALFNRLKSKREAEIIRYQVAGDYDNLMRVNRELSDETRKMFGQVKLVLSDEQKKAYTTVGGTPHLDGEYTVFGEVIGGLEVVERIAARETDEHFRPVEDVVINKMEIE